MSKWKKKKKKKNDRTVTQDQYCWNSRTPEHEHSSLPDEWTGAYVDEDDKTVSKFSYEPLKITEDEFRLFTILPNSASSRIEVVLDHRVHEPRSYSCLSYNWGESEDTRTILVNGASFSVRKNLWTFLWQARENGYFGPLWIDAICINQEDISERNHAVREMSKIYKQAKEVIVWLGQIPASLQVKMCRGLFFLARDDATSFWSMSSQKASECLNWISDTAYWTRTWILPEIHLAASLYMMVGCKKISFERVRCEYLRYASNLASEDRAYLVFGTWSTRIDKRRICYRLVRDSYCLHPRDQFYSMIGVIPALRQLRIQYDIDDGAVLLDVYEESGPRDLYSLISLITVIGDGIGMRGALHSVACTKRLSTTAQEKLDHACDAVRLTHESVAPDHKPLLSWYRSYSLGCDGHLVVLATKPYVSTAICSRNGCRLLRWSASNTWPVTMHRNRFIDWKLSQRIDDHHLLLALGGSSHNSIWAGHTLPKGKSWWEKGLDDYEFLHHNLPEH